MLFGRPGGGGESVQLYDLGPLLDKSLDKKLSSLASRASSILREMQQARDQFARACRDFEALSVEPDTEYTRLSNANFIKSQKGFYTNALRHSVESWNLSYGEARNLYEGYSAVLSEADAFAAGVLKANATFKKVMHAYPNHLGQFKTSFSFIERSIDSLRGEIERRKPEYSEYRRVIDSAKGIASKRDELADLTARINSSAENLSRSAAEPPDGRQAKLSADIASIGSELSVKDAQISEMTSRINSLTLPLERAARKLDHILAAKRQLYTFVTDPVNTLREESDTKDFLTLVAQLKKLLSAGSIDVKNPERIEKVADELLSTDIHAMMLALSERKRERHELVQRIEHAKRELRRLEESSAAIGNASERLESMRRRAEELGAAIKSEKEQAERLFLEYYGRKISIIV